MLRGHILTLSLYPPYTPTFFPTVQWRHTSVSTHHLQQFAVYLSFTFRLHSAVRSSGRRGQMTQSCTNCLQGAGQRRGSSIHHQRLSSTRRGGEDIFAPLYPGLHNILDSLFKNVCLERPQIKREGSMRPMQQWVGGPCCLQSSAGQGQDLLHSSES